jgi:hypothetical protein
MPGAGRVISRTKLTHNEGSHNALSGDALLANEGLRAALASSALNSATLQSAPPPTPEYAALTSELTKYIVSCALAPAPDRTVSDGTTTYDGELGLCDQWFDERPSPLCQQIVSACVLARVNALKHRVVISLRGTPAALFPLQDSVAVETELRDKTFVASTQNECAPDGDMTRNCGWKAWHVGRCTAGHTVTVCTGANGSPDCGCSAASPTDLPMLRVCKGLYACDDPSGTPAAGAVPEYAGLVAEGPACGASAGSPLQFVCPNNGPLVDPGQPSGPRHGYFSLMMTSQSPAATVPAESAVSFIDATDPTDTVKYPAPEADVFTYREGAFFGNIFSSTTIDDKANLYKQSLPGDLYACYSNEWSCGLAHLTDRFCAGAGSPVALEAGQECDEVATMAGPVLREPCFFNRPVPCAGSAPHNCASDHVEPGDYYMGCRGTPEGTVWLEPITVYLNHPCDVSLDGKCGLSAIGKTATIEPQ